MKTLFKCLSILLIPILTFAQQNPTETYKVREDLLLKSRNQKTTAFFMLGLGAAAVVGGVLMFEDDFTVMGEGDNSGAAAGVVLGVAGGLSMLGSIPMFIASSNNKQKAMAMSAGLKVERVPLSISHGSAGYPALAVNFRIRQDISVGEWRNVDPSGGFSLQPDDRFLQYRTRFISDNGDRFPVQKKVTVAIGDNKKKQEDAL